MVRLLASLVAVAALGALTTATAQSRRAPTWNERVAIIRALPEELRAYPAGCVVFVVAVSNDGRYATAGMNFLLQRPLRPNDPCAKYASNGEFILKKGKGWKIVYNGSSGPDCKLGVPRDLERCVRY